MRSRRIGRNAGIDAVKGLPLPVAAPALDQGWPESWRMSHSFDVLELVDDLRLSPDPGYVRAYRQRVRLALDLLNEHAEQGAEVLDVAAAQGNLTVALAMCGYRVTWNDLREELAGYVRMKLGVQHVRFCPGNVLEIDVDPVDVVLATEVIEHVAHPDVFLQRLGELVRPNGYVIVTTPNGRFVRNTLPKFSDCADPEVFESGQFKPDADGHIFLLHPDEFEPLGRAAGLELVRIAYATSFLARGWMRTDVLARNLPEQLIAVLDRAVVHGPAAVRDRLSVQLAAVFRRPS
jgi:2-polyprenyl-3-methyl-5-hydroxy-6-metoxy-1,4-benzoquinol methylase